MIAARAVAVGHGSRTFLADVDLDVRGGEMTGLIGPSGSGKTSLMRVLAGLEQPRAGTVEIDGGPLPKRPDGRVAFLFQSPRRAFDPRLTLRRSIALLADGEVDWATVCERAALERGLLDRLPSQVSEGQLQRAALARAFAGSPRYLLCDEITSSLDPAAAAAVVVSVRAAAQAGAGVLLVSHDVRLAEACCDRVFRVVGGALAQTSVRQELVGADER